MKKTDYQKGGYLKIELTDDDDIVVIKEEEPVKEIRKNPFEKEVFSIKEDILHLEEIMQRLKNTK